MWAPRQNLEEHHMLLFSVSKPFLYSITIVNGLKNNQKTISAVFHVYHSETFCLIKCHG